MKRILGTAEDYRRLYGPDSPAGDADALPAVAHAPAAAPAHAAAPAAAKKKPAPVKKKAAARKKEGRVASRSAIAMSKLTGSKKATQFTESVIREMTRLATCYGAVNLSQGFPDFPAPAGDQGGGLRRDRRRRQPVRDHLGRAAAARGDRREFTRRYGLPIVAESRSPSAAARPRR